MLFTVALFAYGLFQLTQLPIDAVPDITDNQVQVITVSPSLGAPDVERFITFPIEQANSNIAGLKEIRSFSRFGLSVVTVVFKDNIDVYWARQQVSERLQQVQAALPAGIGTPGLAPVTTGLGEIYQYVLRPQPGFEDRYTPVELRTIQDWIVRRQLLGVPGVADVSTFGGLLKQYEVRVRSERLKSYGLTIGDVFNALAANNQNAGGSYIEKGPTVLFIRTEGLARKLSDLEQVVVKTTASGNPITLRDVATVGYGTATRYGAVCYNDQGETAGAVVMMLKGANSSAVIDRVKERIAIIQKSLPEGVVIEPFLDRSKMVNNAISTVKTNLIEGALIVVFVLVLFLGNFRAGLVVASVIPLAMLFAVIMMNIFGVSGNLMSLGALDFGLIVDGAVIIVEAVMHQLAHAKIIPSRGSLFLSQDQMDTEVEKSASKMMNAAVFGQIIILVVYLPIFALEGIEGKMFRPMAQTVSFALIGAFLLSLTYIPALAAIALSKKKTENKGFSDRIMHRLEQFFQKSLKKGLQFPKTILIAAAAAFGLSMVVMSTLGGEFIPELEEGDFAVDTRVLTGSNLGTTIASTQQTAKILLEQFPEVEKVVTKIGSGEIPTDPMPIEASDMMVILKDKKQWTSAKRFDELADKMSTALQAVPGVTTGFQYPVQMRFNELMTGAKQDVVCKIFGENLDSLAAIAERLGAVVSQVEGATELYVEAVTGMPQIVIKHRREALAQYGLSIETVNQTVNAAFAGSVAGQIFEDEKRFDLVVRLEQQQRSSLTDVQNLLIATPSGLQIPLYLVAEVSITEGPNQIQRDNAQRRILVGFNVRGRDVQSVVAELQQKVETQITFPAGYFVHYGGSFENLQAANKRLSLAVPVSLLLIFLMLYFAFGSIQQGLLIFTAIPLSAVGGILALALRGLPFSISAGIGFIALFGVAVLNGIVLITEFNRLKTNGLHDLHQIVLQGTRNRLRPVLMTAAVASLGFIPMAFSHGAGAEVQRPLATVVIGGLISATLLTLFLLPVLYVFFGKIRRIAPQQTTLMALLIGLCYTPILSAQKPISVQAAVDLAIQNNPTLRPYHLSVDQSRLLQRTARDLPKTDILVETGQINTAYWDNRLGVSQVLPSNKATRAKSAFLLQNTRVDETDLFYQQQMLAFEVKNHYAEIASLQERIAAIHLADSLYAASAERANNRLQAGESNRMEKANIDLQKSHTTRQMRLLAAERSLLLAQFHRLLGTTEMLEPQVGLFPTPSLTRPSDAPSNLVAPAQARWTLASRNTQWAKVALMPEYRVGFSVQSIRGPQTVNGTNREYGLSPQFFTAQFGTSLPVFKKAARMKVQAALIGESKAQADFRAAQYDLDTRYQAAIQTFERYQEALLTYERDTRPMVEGLLQMADNQLKNGEINYLEWMITLQQVVAARTEYAELMLQYNRAAVMLDHLSN